MLRYDQINVGHFLFRCQMPFWVTWSPLFNCLTASKAQLTSLHSLSGKKQDNKKLGIGAKEVQVQGRWKKQGAYKHLVFSFLPAIFHMFYQILFFYLFFFNQILTHCSVLVFWATSIPHLSLFSFRQLIICEFL